MIPYAAYMTTNLTLLVLASEEEGERDPVNHALIATLSGATLLQWIYQAYQEAVQIKRIYPNLGQYFTSWWNIFDLIHLILTPVLCVNNMFKDPPIV